jgi:hypothetical protein
VIPSLIKQVYYSLLASPSPVFLRHLNLLHIDENTIIPSYFTDKVILVHLAFILFPQLGGNALERIGLQYLDEDDEGSEHAEMKAANLVVDEEMMIDEENTELVMQEKDDSDLELLEVPPPIFGSIKKKKKVKLLEKLDDEFLRHSKRVSKKLGASRVLTVLRSTKKASLRASPLHKRRARSPSTTRRPRKLLKRLRKLHNQSLWQWWHPLAPRSPHISLGRSYKALVKAFSRFSLWLSLPPC